MFAGYSTARNAVGWSKYTYRRGVISQCLIFINPQYLRRYEISNTMSHEIGHCLGVSGHFGTRGNLMARYGGHGVSPETVAMLNYLYSVPAGARL